MPLDYKLELFKSALALLIACRRTVLGCAGSIVSVAVTDATPEGIVCNSLRIRFGNAPGRTG